MSLSGTRVVVTRASGREGGLSDLLRSAGAEVLVTPTIAIAPPESWGEVDDAIGLISDGDADWVVFTSANGVESFCSRVGAEAAEILERAKVAAVGTATEAALAARGIVVSLVPDEFTAAGLATALGPGPGRIVLPRAASVPPTMVEFLNEAGWETIEVTAYRTELVQPEGPDAEAVASGRFDVVTFTSASTVAGFTAAFDVDALELTSGSGPRRVAVIGPVTAEECRFRGLRVDVEASPHTAAGLVEALQAAAGK